MDHGAQILSSCDQRVNVSVSWFGIFVWVFNAYRSEGMVSVRETGIGYYLGQDALKSDFFDLLLFLLLLSSSSTAFIFTTLLALIATFPFILSGLIIFLICF